MTWISLSWAEPEALYRSRNISSYVILAMTHGTQGGTAVPTAPGITAFNVTNLSPNTVYMIAVVPAAASPVVNGTQNNLGYASDLIFATTLGTGMFFFCFFIQS